MLSLTANIPLIILQTLPSLSGVLYFLTVFHFYMSRFPLLNFTGSVPFFFITAYLGIISLCMEAVQ